MATTAVFTIIPTALNVDAGRSGKDDVRSLRRILR
jgi:hypothetical protein